MGGLGYVPAALTAALQSLGVTNVRETISDIAVVVASTAHGKWKARCSALVNSPEWAAGRATANTEVDTALGTRP
jgi:hypothetical protein